MKKLTCLTVVTLAAALSGCATTNGQPSVFKNQATEQSAIGCGVGGVLAYGIAKATGGDARTANIAAASGCAAGAVVGYQRGKTMDLQLALQARQNIMTHTTFVPVFRDEQRQVVRPDVVERIASNPRNPDYSQINSMEVPIGFVEMISGKPASLTKQARGTLQSMDQMAVESASEMHVFIPASKLDRNSVIVGQIKAAAPHAYLDADPTGKDFHVVVHKRVSQRQQ